MWNIFWKDFKSFFSGWTGLTVPLVFLLITGLFLWLMEGQYNILYGAYAELTPFFDLVPWLFLFIIPAVGMRSLSAEYRSGTIELLLTKPVKTSALVGGKWLAVWMFVLYVLLPTAVYVYSVYALALPGNRPDPGIIFAGYLGLILLAAVFSAVGVFVSASVSGQMPAYLGGVFLSFLIFYGFYGLGNFNLFGSLDYFLRSVSLLNAYEHFGKGLIYIKDLAWMIFWILLFLSAAVWRVKRYRS